MNIWWAPVFLKYNNSLITPLTVTNNREAVKNYLAERETNIFKMESIIKNIAKGTTDPGQWVLIQHV